MAIMYNITLWIIPQNEKNKLKIDVVDNLVDGHLTITTHNYRPY